MGIIKGGRSKACVFSLLTFPMTPVSLFLTTLFLCFCFFLVPSRLEKTVFENTTGNYNESNVYTGRISDKSQHQVAADFIYLLCIESLFLYLFYVKTREMQS